ncbi:hypothetical protein DASC09_042250 [Saccharomycopsis crataegensis]|uniref:Uncharacterized protein n=1 Tax=Saccharomycopsis crataegensis TaxID=43959 RepID=A0AAV5QQT4_9ASCO|nr:hypothetical protein DASC09_042250 [Saccharomycopsis crataegensis]
METLFSCVWDDYAEEHLQFTHDPYYQETNGKCHKVKAPLGCTPQEISGWKSIQKTAWKHDRCACGCMPVDCGIGKASLITIIPMVGPFLMYAVHAKLLEHANSQLNGGIPQGLMAKMYGNILFDFLITLPPVLGVVFGYLNSCSTRNAAIIHTHLRTLCKSREDAQTRAREEGVGYSYGHRVEEISNVNDRFDEGTYGRTTNTQNTRSKKQKQSEQKVVRGQYDPIDYHQEMGQQQ